MTKTDALIKGLSLRGFVKSAIQPSRKYVKFESPGQDKAYWLGKSAALRVGRYSSDTVSLTGNRFYHELLAAGGFAE